MNANTININSILTQLHHHMVHYKMVDCQVLTKVIVIIVTAVILVIQVIQQAIHLQCHGIDISYIRHINDANVNYLNSHNNNKN